VLRKVTHAALGLHCTGTALKCDVLWLRRVGRAAGLVSVVYIKHNNANQRRNLALLQRCGGGGSKSAAGDTAPRSTTTTASKVPPLAVVVPVVA
jgi:hypothetical protein